MYMLMMKIYVVIGMKLIVFLTIITMIISLIDENSSKIYLIKSSSNVTCSASAIFIAV